MRNISFAATILCAVLLFPQIFGCAGTDFGRAMENGMGSDAFHPIVILGARDKHVVLARMAFSKDAAVVLPGLRYFRIAPNPQTISVVLEYSANGTDYAVIRNTLADGKIMSSVLMIPPSAAASTLYSLDNDNGTPYSAQPAGKGFIILAQQKTDDPARTSVRVLSTNSVVATAEMCGEALAQGVVYDPSSSKIISVKKYSRGSKKQKSRETSPSINMDAVPSAKSVPLSTKVEQPAASGANGGSPTAAPQSGSAHDAGAAAPGKTEAPAPEEPKKLQDSKTDTQLIL